MWRRINVSEKVTGTVELLSLPNKTPGSLGVKKMRPVITGPFPPFNVNNSIEKH